MKKETSDLCFVKFLGLVLALVFTFSVVSAVAPSGATLANISSQRATADSATTHNALAGNVTEIKITAFSPTQAWTGFYGNVSGTIELAYTDGTDKVMYNWSLANPEGEVYAVQSSSISWQYIQCFNYTATSADADACEDEATYSGAGCPTGMNLTDLENHFNIAADDVDGIDETMPTSDAHTAFYTNNKHFTDGDGCPSTDIFDSTGRSVDGNFEEILLYDPSTQLPGYTGNEGIPIFVALIEETATDGFDERDHDFEMLVLEDGHGTNTGTTTYYFYVELE
jgi:hypothetical protein